MHARQSKSCTQQTLKEIRKGKSSSKLLKKQRTIEEEGNFQQVKLASTAPMRSAMRHPLIYQILVKLNKPKEDEDKLIDRQQFNGTSNYICMQQHAQSIDFLTLEFKESTSNEKSNEQSSTGANETEFECMLNCKFLDKVN